MPRGDAYVIRAELGVVGLGVDASRADFVTLRPGEVVLLLDTANHGGTYDVDTFLTRHGVIVTSEYYRNPSIARTRGWHYMTLLEGDT